MEITGLDIKIEKGSQASDFSEMLQGYEYGLLYYLSEVKLAALGGGNPSNAEQLKDETSSNLNQLEGEIIPNLTQLIEARLFSADKELHIFQNEEGWQAVLVEETGQAEYLDEWRPISREFQSAGKQLGVRRYLSYDEDGQAYAALTRLYAVKGGN